MGPLKPIPTAGLDIKPGMKPQPLLARPIKQPAKPEVSTAGCWIILLIVLTIAGLVWSIGYQAARHNNVRDYYSTPMHRH